MTNGCLSTQPNKPPTTDGATRGQCSAEDKKPFEEKAAELKAGQRMASHLGHLLARTRVFPSVNSCIEAISQPFLCQRECPARVGGIKVN